MHNYQIRNFLVQHRDQQPAKLNPPFTNELLDFVLQSPRDLSKVVGIALPDKEDSITTELFADQDIVMCLIELAYAPQTRNFISNPHLYKSDLDEFLDTIFQIVKLYANSRKEFDRNGDIAGRLK